MTRCAATLPWDIDDTLSDDLACTLGEGHLSPHHTTTSVVKDTAAHHIEAVTSITWTNE